MTLKERMLAVLRTRGPMTDSDLARTLDTRHQSVNQAARELAEEGRITRAAHGGKLTNVVVTAAVPPTVVGPVVAVGRPNASIPPLPPPRSVALISCVKSKLDHPAPATELYTSALFKRQRAWATARCRAWFILSAKHGLLRPNDVITPYELTLKGVSVVERRAWSNLVLDQLRAELQTLNGRYFEVYASKVYCDDGLTEGLRRAGATVVFPWDGLSLGQRLARNEYGSNE